MLLGPEPSADAIALSKKIRAAWTAFARTGNPGWPRYETPQALVRVFDVPAQITGYPEYESCRIWEEHSFAALPLLG